MGISRKPKALAVQAAALVLFVQLMMVGPANAQEPSDAQGKGNQGTVQMVLNWYHNIVQGHIDQASKLLAADYVDHDPRISGGRDGFVKYYGNARRPDAKQITAFAQGDYVVVVWDRTDKDPGTGTPYDYTTYDVVRLKSGKIVEHWDNAHKDSIW